jgi:PST family polysaccharide transporter
MLAGNFSNVLFPALVPLRSDPPRQVNAALDASVLLSFCIMPFAMLQAAIAAPLITSLFGERWAPAIPVIQLLSIGLAIDAVSWIVGTLLSARGDFRVVLRYALIQMPIFFALVVIGAVLNKAVGVAWCICIFYAATKPFFVNHAYRRMGASTRQVVAIYARPTLFSMAAVGAALLVSALATHPLARAAIILTLGGALYAVLVRWFAPAIWHAMRSRLEAALHRRRTSTVS